MMKGSIGIVGAGILGRLLAYLLKDRDYNVTLFDQGNANGDHNCSYASAGMLAPYCEKESSHPLIFKLGLESLELWKQIVTDLKRPSLFEQSGSLVVAHEADSNELERLKRNFKSPESNEVEFLNASSIADLEPSLKGRFSKGLFFPKEAYLNNRQLLLNLAENLLAHGVRCLFETEVVQIEGHQMMTKNQTFQFDWIVDCRGLKAKKDLKGLHGVRGELFVVETRDIKLHRPIRVMHPRYPLYIVPRPDSKYLIGATSIESEDLSPISVRSTLELLSAAYALHPAFSEARILESVVHLRPTFPDHLPHIVVGNNLLRVNGLYRHGFLISPLLAKIVAQFIEEGKIEATWKPLFKDN